VPVISSNETAALNRTLGLGLHPHEVELARDFAEALLPSLFGLNEPVRSAHG
jgi:hypothetical protein